MINLNVENLPKPADKCNYCGVCRENFSEYLSVKNLQIFKAY